MASRVKTTPSTSTHARLEGQQPRLSVADTGRCQPTPATPGWLGALSPRVPSLRRGERSGGRALLVQLALHWALQGCGWGQARGRCAAWMRTWSVTSRWAEILGQALEKGGLLRFQLGRVGG